MTIVRSPRIIISAVLFSVALSFTFIIFSAPAYAAPASDSLIPSLPESQDVRIVVDISGSMKDSDPANLRQPAVRMLARLLPAGSRSGVWTFGQYVNMLVGIDTVDDKWRDQAINQSRKINSVALRTNIGRALETASDDFLGDRRFDNTHFIVLTDGVVDISADRAANDKERKRILSDVVQKRIESRGGTIHTIALSDQADSALLERMAVDTGGSFAVATTADELNQAFAAALNKAVPQPELPIRDNGFQVDKGIDEFTALIFHSEPGGSLTLTDPDGTVLEVESKPDNVRWVHEAPYDLITVTQPKSGGWKINGELGEQSRVTVVSDLRMAVAPLPAFFYTGQSVDVEAAFYEKENVITDPDFLNVIDVSLTLVTEEGRSGSKPLSSEAPPADGVYRDAIKKLKQPGTYELSLVADGKTFSRQYSTRITLRPPVSIEIKGEGKGEGSSYDILVRPEHPDLNTDSAEVGLRSLKSEVDGAEVPFESLKYDAALGGWHGTVTPDSGQGNYSVALRFRGEASNGERLSYVPQPYIASFPRSDAAASPYASMSATPTDEAEITDELQTAVSAAREEENITPETEESPVVMAEPEEASPEMAAAPEEPAAPQADEAQDEIVPPIDISEAEPAQQDDATENQPEEPSKLPAWIWIALGGVVAVLLLVFAVLRARKKDRNSPDEDSVTAAEAAKEPEPEDEEALPVLDESEVSDVEIPELQDDMAEVEEPELPVAEEEVADTEIDDIAPEPQAEDEPEPESFEIPEESEVPELDVSQDDILPPDTELDSDHAGPLTESEQPEDGFMMEEFDLSDIDDLPDLDSTEGTEDESPENAPERNSDEDDDSGKKGGV
ncbi:VWA domain-containing protein [Marinobacter sp. 1Y8]